MSLMKFVRPEGIAIYDPNELMEHAVMPAFKRLCVVSNAMAQEFRKFYFIVVVHGSPMHVTGQSGPDRWSPQDFYNQVIGEAHFYDAIYKQRKGVFLMSCKTGRGFASEVCNHIGAPVLAPSENASASGITPSNNITIRMRDPLGKWRFHIPGNGFINLNNGPILFMPEAVSLHKMFWK